jgi:DNA-binding CsgD family transcriptional regulator
MSTMNQGLINSSRNFTHNAATKKMGSQLLSYDKISDMGFDENMDQSSEILSDREKEILQLIIKDKSSKAIADDLSISYRTVETHRRNIFKKLGVRNSLTLMKKIIELDFKFES